MKEELTQFNRRVASLSDSVASLADSVARIEGQIIEMKAEQRERDIRLDERLSKRDAELDERDKKRDAEMEKRFQRYIGIVLEKIDDKFKLVAEAFSGERVHRVDLQNRVGVLEEDQALNLMRLSMLGKSG